MSATKNVELTRDQQSLLLDGLSYLRNSTLLEMRFPSEEENNAREKQLREIEDLVDHIRGTQAREAVSV